MFLSFDREVLQAFMTSLCNTWCHNATQYLYLFLSKHNVYYPGVKWDLCNLQRVQLGGCLCRASRGAVTATTDRHWGARGAQLTGRVLVDFFHCKTFDGMKYIIMVWFIYVLVSFNMAPPPTTLPLVVVGGSCGRLVVITTDSSTYRHYQ